MKPAPSLKRGGWSGGPCAKDTGSLAWALVCLAVGAGAVVAMILLTSR